MAENANREFRLNFGEADTQEEAKEEKEVRKVVYSEMTRADRPVFQWLRKVMIFGFVAIFVGACLWQIDSLKKESEALDQTMAQLEEQIEDEKAQELDIKVKKKYQQSIAYREQMARDRCKLIYPNEILISIQQKK